MRHADIVAASRARGSTKKIRKKARTAAALRPGQSARERARGGLYVYLSTQAWDLRIQIYSIDVSIRDHIESVHVSMHGHQGRTARRK